MKRILFIILLLSMTLGVSPAHAEKTMLEWDAPTTNDDPGQTPLTNLAGYYIYCYNAPNGQPPTPDKSGYYVDSPTPSPQPGDVVRVLIAAACGGIVKPYARGTAINVYGNESKYSNEVNCGLAPSPIGLRCK